MRTFLVLCKKRKFFTEAPPLTISVTILYFKYRKSGGSNRRWKIYGRNSLLMRTFLVFCKKRKYFTQAPPQKYCCYIASSIQKITGFNSMVEDLRKKFSLHANISCVMQDTKIFHQGPPSTGRFKEEIFFRCEHFLCYARNENISPRPPFNWKIL